MKRFLILAILLGLVGAASAAMDESRTWEETMDTDPDATTDWEGRGGVPANYTISDGKMIFSSSAPWQALDTDEHFFLNRTTITMIWECTGGSETEGIGWWCNFWNDGSTGGYSAVYCMLRPDGAGQKVVFDGPQAPNTTITGFASGQITGTFIVQDGATPTLSYSLSDGTTTETGSINLTRSPSPQATTDAWFTLVNFAAGAGEIDYVKVENVIEQPIDCAWVYIEGYGLTMDLDKNCYVGLSDFAMLAVDWLNCMDPTNIACDAPWE